MVSAATKAPRNNAELHSFLKSKVIELIVYSCEMSDYFSSDVNRITSMCQECLMTTADVERDSAALEF